MDRTVLDSHVARCAECRQFRERSEALARRIRVRRAEPVPDTTAAILAAIPQGPAADRSGPQVSLQLVVAAAVAVVVLTAGAFTGGRLLTAGSGSGPLQVTQVAGSTQQSPRYPGATVVDRSYPKPDVTLTDTAGQPYNLVERTAGAITLVFFGYTHCRDVCPTTMAMTAAALRHLPAADRPKIKVVFVTTDPQRDTAPVIRAWLDNFNSSFVGLAGSDDQIRQAEKIVNMPLSYSGVSPAASAPGDDYEVVHASYTLLYTADGVAHLQIDASEQLSGFVTTLKHLVAHGYQTA